MDDLDYGGIKVIDVKSKGFNALLGSGPYYYEACQGPRVLTVQSPIEICVVNLSDYEIQLNGCKIPIGHNLRGVFQESCDLAAHTDARYLIAYQSAVDNLPISITPTRLAKQVKKPWGYEIWLTGETPIFAFKEIFIKKGTKTSLQFHKFKRETNFILSGSVNLHYSKQRGADYFQGKLVNTEFKRLEAGKVIDVYPDFIHRLEALEDTLLFEVSTPELDDVIRIQDDSQRSHGKIETEHKTS